MAVELCSENSPLVTSPARISFSHDLSQSDVVPIEPHVFRSNSSSATDFDFCNFNPYNHQSPSSADELFSDGKILPTQIKQNPIPIPPKKTQRPSKYEIGEGSKAETTRGAILETEEKQGSRSFWRFKRSSSLNCGGSGYGPSLCPLPLLSRSNSTGSANSQKQSSKKNNNSSVLKPSSQSQGSSSYQKPPLKKSYGGSYGNNIGVRINPVLNVPSSGNFLGLGSIFFNGKEKSKRK